MYLLQWLQQACWLTAVHHTHHCVQLWPHHLAQHPKLLWLFHDTKNRESIKYAVCQLSYTWSLALNSQKRKIRDTVKTFCITHQCTWEHLCGFYQILGALWKLFWLNYLQTKEICSWQLKWSKRKIFKQLGKKIINTVVTNEKSLKFICNCCVKYLIKKIAFYHSIYHKF